MNSVVIVGNVCKDPEAFTTQNNVTRSSFTVAVQRRFRNSSGQREADFLNVVAWRQTAEYCNKYLHKGSKVAVEGTVQNRSFTAQDGSTRWVTEIIADSVEGLDKREDKPRTEPEQFQEVEDDELPWEG